MGAKSTDPALWTLRRVFGPAGGPDEVVLTDEGMKRAFSVGARVRRGAAADALEALGAAGGDGLLSMADGARLRRTDLGRFDQVAWGHLRALGYVESFDRDGVRLTQSGRYAIACAREEQAYLLARCKEAAGASGELPFGVDRPEALLEPFCACGRVISKCDRSRAKCRERSIGRATPKTGGTPP